MSDCSLCKRPIVQDVHIGEVCSEFCGSATAEEKEEFRNGVVGEYLVFPCRLCGIPVEGEWYPEDVKQSCCSDCYKAERLEKRTLLLQEAKLGIGWHRGADDPLYIRMEEELKLDEP